MATLSILSFYVRSIEVLHALAYHCSASTLLPKYLLVSPRFPLLAYNTHPQSLEYYLVNQRLQSQVKRIEILGEIRNCHYLRQMLQKENEGYVLLETLTF